MPLFSFSTRTDACDAGDVVTQKIADAATGAVSASLSNTPTVLLSPLLLTSASAFGLSSGQACAAHTQDL